MWRTLKNLINKDHLEVDFSSLNIAQNKEKIENQLNMFSVNSIRDLVSNIPPASKLINVLDTQAKFKSIMGNTRVVCWATTFSY